MTPPTIGSTITVRHEDRIVRAQVVDARHVPAVAAPFPDLWPSRTTHDLVRLDEQGPWYDLATGRLYRTRG